MIISGFDYTVDRSKTVDEIGALGRLRVKDQSILIGSDLCKQQTEATLLHEIIEAANYHFELNLEHRAVMALEAVLYQTLTENGVDLSPLAKEGRR